MANVKGTVWPFVSSKAENQSLTWKVYSPHLEVGHHYCQRWGIWAQSLYKWTLLLLLFTTQLKLFRFFTNWSLQTWVSFRCHFLTNLLFLCLKSIKAAGFPLRPHFYETSVHIIKISFFSLNLSCANFINSATGTQVVGVSFLLLALQMECLCLPQIHVLKSWHPKGYWAFEGD